MNVVERICAKYPTEYNLMLDRRMRPIDLTFSPAVPAALQDQIMDNLFKMGVFLEDSGLSMRLDVDSDGYYTLCLPGDIQYRFADRAARFSFPDYDMPSAISWTLWILASGKNWLSDCQGKFISCRCFSARQQAAAVRIAKSVEAQFGSSFSQDKITRFYAELQKFVTEIIHRSPRFSSRPIPEEAFRAFRGKNQEVTVGELAEALFGPNTFAEELHLYLDRIRTSRAYRSRLEAARSELTAMAYDLPIMAVSYFFTELRAYIDTIHASPLDGLASAFRQQIRFTLTPANLRSAFEQVDNIYLAHLETMLQQEFFQTVCEEALAMINQEILAAKKNVAILRNALHRFCFLEDDCFGQSDKIYTPLSWKQLSALSENEVFSPDVSWDTGSLNELQSILKSVYAPQVWICSDRLKNLADKEMINDAFNTRSAPVMDERLVWAIWADANVE